MTLAQIETLLKLAAFRFFRYTAFNRGILLARVLAATRRPHRRAAAAPRSLYRPYRISFLRPHTPFV